MTVEQGSVSTPLTRLQENEHDHHHNLNILRLWTLSVFDTSHLESIFFSPLGQVLSLNIHSKCKQDIKNDRARRWETHKTTFTVKHAHSVDSLHTCDKQE